MNRDMLLVDGLQYVNWNRGLFEKAQRSGLSAIHVTIAYWENIRETLENIGNWNRHFINHADLIMPIHQAADILEAKRLSKVGIIFAFKNEVFPEPGSPKSATKLESANCLKSNNLIFSFP